MKIYYRVFNSAYTRTFYKFKRLLKFINKQPPYALPEIRKFKNGYWFVGRYIQNKKSIGVDF